LNGTSDPAAVMPLLADHPHIIGFSLAADPQAAVPGGRCAMVETDLDPGTIDDTEREKIAEMVGWVEMSLRAKKLDFTRVILRQRHTVLGRTN
jgi:hypothetical protein